MSQDETHGTSNTLNRSLRILEHLGKGSKRIIYTFLFSKNQPKVPTEVLLRDNTQGCWKITYFKDSPFSYPDKPQAYKSKVLSFPEKAYLMGFCCLRK